MYKKVPKKRYAITLGLVEKFISKDEKILDLGVENPLSNLIREKGYQVQNTDGEDLDDEFLQLKEIDADVVTAFEILEHLLNPYSVLKNLPGKKLLITVPLQLWFAAPYRNMNDIRDWHYHEFTDWQLDRLLEKTGWEIKFRKKWTNPAGKIGVRPLLRKITPRYYAVYAERK
ncbi:class I SAM-dependent methyltransferase [Moheibacter lacus]|uniref:Methyltransferase n=1 Tax=Moheibacter lacus TaxID=2745851 RepID=A0A838ZQ36_9FLAO|nr:methyltransferase [Moheibacter lacus]MBA5629777.1 methyltransferase [Moheibacter lacus]